MAAALCCCGCLCVCVCFAGTVLNIHLEPQQTAADVRANGATDKRDSARKRGRRGPGASSHHRGSRRRGCRCSECTRGRGQGRGKVPGNGSRNRKRADGGGMGWPGAGLVRDVASLAAKRRRGRGVAERASRSGCRGAGGVGPSPHGPRGPAGRLSRAAARSPARPTLRRARRAGCEPSQHVNGHGDGRDRGGGRHVRLGRAGAPRASGRAARRRHLCRPPEPRQAGREERSGVSVGRGKRRAGIAYQRPSGRYRVTGAGRDGATDQVNISEASGDYSQTPASRLLCWFVRGTVPRAESFGRARDKGRPTCSRDEPSLRAEPGHVVCSSAINRMKRENRQVLCLSQAGFLGSSRYPYPGSSGWTRGPGYPGWRVGDQVAEYWLTRVNAREL